MGSQGTHKTIILLVFSFDPIAFLFLINIPIFDYFPSLLLIISRKWTPAEEGSSCDLPWNIAFGFLVVEKKHYLFKRWVSSTRRDAELPFCLRYKF